MTTLTCYGGAAEIGGNKILLEDRGARLLLDFGTAFGRQQAFYNEFLRPRPARGLLDLLALELIPPLEGLYRDDLAFPGLWDRFRGHPHYRDLRRGARPAVDGVLLSHAHLDHNGDLSYLDGRIPVHATRVSGFVARSMQVSGVTNFEREMVYLAPRACNRTGEIVTASDQPYRCRPHAFLDGPLSAEADRYWAASPAVRRKLEIPPPPAAPTTIGELNLVWWPVDHSIPGAAGFAVHTEAGWIAYSGDIRFHGARGADTRRFAEELARIRPVALLCEGTHLDGGAEIKETDIVDHAGRLLRDAAGRLAIADFGPRNVERLYSFLAVARSAGRVLAAQPKDLYLLEAIHLADPVAFPDPASVDGLSLYADPRTAPRSWERELRDRWSGRTVMPPAVSARPGDYLLCFSLWDANDLLDLECRGGIYLYSNSRAYDDEARVDLERLRHWARHMELAMHGDPDSPRVPLHASGHAGGAELLEFVGTVRPRELIPIHTEAPEWWESRLAGSGIAVRRPAYGQPIVFG